MDTILGHKLATLPPIVVESGNARNVRKTLEETEEAETEGQEKAEKFTSSCEEPSQQFERSRLQKETSLGQLYR